MIDKDDLVRSIGQRESSTHVQDLLSKLGSEGKWLFHDGLEEKYFLSKRRGLSLLFDKDNVLISIHLYLDNRDGYEKYDGWIGDGIKKSADEKRLIAVNGAPNKRGGGEKGFMGRIASPWLRWDCSDYVLHYELTSDGSQIAMVTIMDLKTAP